jgi:hypothetical protein
MRELKADNVYTFFCSEAEWYGQADAEKQRLQEALKTKMQLTGCAYGTILVSPDPLLSSIESDRRHSVYDHAFPTDEEEEFRNALARAYMRSKLTPRRRLAIAKEVLGL